jgi:hypothetical protein
MLKGCLVAALAVLASPAVQAAELSVGDAPARTYRVRHYWRAVPQHVVEVAIRPLGHQYIINGRYWTGTSNACFGWGPKQRVRMISGEWHGNCATAVIRNVTLGRTCEMICG